MSKNDTVAIRTLSKTVLQSLYHQVTGKTESMSETLSGNVIIQFSDVANLYNRIIDRLDTYKNVFAPTVTVVVKYDNDRVITYSSWERFSKTFSTGDSITSEIIIKIESILEIAYTESQQRCIINICLDSSLPVFCSDRFKNEIINRPGMLFINKIEWDTALISIDYVDFLVAKAFLNDIREWFNRLTKTPHKRYNKFIRNNIIFVSRSLKNAGIIVSSIIVLTYAFKSGNVDSRDVLKLCGISGVFLYIYSLMSLTFERRLNKSVFSSMIPSVLLLSAADSQKFEGLKGSISELRKTLFQSLLYIFTSIFLGVVTSYIYDYLKK